MIYYNKNETKKTKDDEFNNNKKEAHNERENQSNIETKIETKKNKVFQH